MKLSEYNITIKIPAFLDYPFVWLILRYRKFRYGYPFRRIRLGRGVYTKVDQQDYQWLSKYDWHLYRRYRSRYAARMDHKKCMFVHMHRMIMSPPKGMVVDHINGDGLDNRRANLRLATHRQNKYNTRPFSRRCTSKYKGVWWAKDREKWCAKVTFKGQTKWVGGFDDEIEAAKARDALAKKYHGQFAWLNFPDD